MSPNPSIDDDQKNKEPYKFRGRGRSKEGPSKPNPWSHAHDEYAEPKQRKAYDTDDNNKATKQHDPNKQKSSSQHRKSTKDKARRGKLPKGGNRPTRIRFEENVANAHSDDEELEEKSNRPLNTNNASVMSARGHTKPPKKRPKKKPTKPTYVNAANIHGQEFRSAYRAKPLPPAPRRTNAQRVENGKEQFNNMIKQAAAMEGV